MKVKAETIIRTIILAVALINQILTLFGYGIIPISNEQIAEAVSLVLTIGASVWAWWKNNSFTKAAIEADEVLNELKKRGENNGVTGLEILSQDQLRKMEKNILFDSAILGALISSCDFVYISEDEEQRPRLQVIDGYNATGILDPITNMLVEGYAVLQRDEYENPLVEAHFIPGETHIITHGDHKVVDEAFDNTAPYPLLVPIIYRPDAKMPFGHSRISRASMDLMDKARNTITRAEVTAEFYSFPQKYVVGLSQDAEPMDTWRATISSMLQFTKDDEGGHPILGQFQTASMTPHHEQLKMYVSAFAGETGLTTDDLGFTADNPSSAEAIKASHENLRLLARKAQRTFGTGFLNVGYLAACVRDKTAYKRTEIYQSVPRWLPLFEPDAAMLSGIGDAFIKLQQAFPNYVTETKLTKLTGI